MWYSQTVLLSRIFLILLYHYTSDNLITFVSVRAGACLHLFACVPLALEGKT